MLLKLQMKNYNYHQGVSGFMRENFDAIVIILILICILLLLCCAILLYMVFLYKNELNQNKTKGILFGNNNICNSNNKNNLVNISTFENIDNNNNSNNKFQILPLTPTIPATTVTLAPVTPSVTPINIIENDSINDITIYSSYNSKSYNKKFVSINSEDNILSNYTSISKQPFDASSNINEYLSHSFSYNNEKIRKHRYHYRKNSSSFINGNNKRFPSIKKPKQFYEHQSSITSTIGSVKSMIKRHYSIRSKNHSRNHSTSNSKIPSILMQNNIPLNFINEELDSKTPSPNDYCQSVNSSITDNNQSSRIKLNYVSSSSSKIKYDEDLPITDVLLPSSSYSYSSKSIHCNNSYDNYIFSDGKNEEFINTVNNIELNNIQKENYDYNKIYNMGYNIIKPEESIYSLSSYSNYSDNMSYGCNIVEELGKDSNDELENELDKLESKQDIKNINKYENKYENEFKHELFNNEYNKGNLEKINGNSMDISSLNIEYKKEE